VLRASHFGARFGIPDGIQQEPCPRRAARAGRAPAVQARRIPGNAGRARAAPAARIPSGDRRCTRRGLIS
jgi:hypothetical protein